MVRFSFREVARKMFRYILAVLLFLLLIPVLWSFSPARLQPRQPHEPTRQTFGIGFDLATSYGTVAISYPNGTLRSIAKVEGDTAYLEMMSRLSLWSSQHLHRPYQYGEAVGDIPRRMLRDIRMKLGLPASRDVGILSNMIKKLYTAAEAFTGEPIYIAAASIPDFAYALYSEDIYEAFDYLQLSYLDIPPWDNWRPIYSSDGAYASYDTRTCSNYTEPSPRGGQSSLRLDPDPREGVPYIFIVSYTRTELEARIDWASCPLIKGPGNHNSTLGHDGLQDAPDEDIHWEGIRRTIRGSRERRLHLNVTQLLITGDAAQNPKFRQILKEETEGEELETFDEYPVFAAARGVAIFVMRELWEQSHRRGIVTNVVQEL